MSTWKKAGRCDRLGLGGQELLPVRGCALRCSVDAGGLEDFPDGGGRDLVPEAGELAADPPVAPGRVVAGHLHRGPADRRAGARASWCPAPVGPAALNQLGVPAQERARGDDQGQLAAARGGRPPGQGGQDRPVGPRQPGCSDLALQDGDLVAQHQDLGVLDVVGARQQRQPAAQPQEDQVQQAEGHKS